MTIKRAAYGIVPHSLFFVGIVTLSTHSDSAMAQNSYCDEAVTEQNLQIACAGDYLDLLGNAVDLNLLLRPIIGNHDGIIIDVDEYLYQHGGYLRISGNINFLDNNKFPAFANVYLGSQRSDGQQTVIDFLGFPRQNTNVSQTGTYYLAFDRMTVENSRLVFKNYRNINDLGTVIAGQINDLFLGNSDFGRGGGLTLKNGGLVFEDSTRFSMNAPNGNAVFITATEGSNQLQLGRGGVIVPPLHLDILNGSDLTISATSISPTLGGSRLRVEQGGTLTINKNSQVKLASSNGASHEPTSFTGAALNLAGTNTELWVTNPTFDSSDISLSLGATLRVADFNGVSSVLNMSGDSSIHFLHPDSSVEGPTVGPDTLTLHVGRGTTRILSDLKMDRDEGLRVDIIEIDEGTLDLSGYSARSDSYSNISSISLSNGGTFLLDSSYFAYFGGLTQLSVNGGILRTGAQFGGLANLSNTNRLAATFNDATFDVNGLTSVTSAGLSGPLSAISVAATSFNFTGNNTVNIGINPSGQCVQFGGACVPGLFRYSGTLDTNLADVSGASFSGFGTVMFIPFADDPNATVADYLTGGANGDGVFTVARHNTDTTHPLASVSYDAAPRTPTVAELAAAGSTIPANLIYKIVNDPVARGQVDIKFVDVGLQNNPSIAASYTQQFTNTVVVEPDTGNAQVVTVAILPDPPPGQSVTWEVTEPTTNNITTITQTAVVDPDTGSQQQTITTVVTEPDGTKLSEETVTVPLDGNGATQHVVTTVTEPDGDHVMTTSVSVSLDPATGTTNTQNYGQLLTSSGNSIPHNAVQQVGTLHPEAYASNMTVALEQSDLRRNMVLSNAVSHVSGNSQVQSVDSDGRRVWLDVGLSSGDVDPDGDLAGFEYDLNQMVIGADVWANSGSRLGAYFGAGQYDMDEHTVSVDTLSYSSKVYSVGLYAVTDAGSWSLSGMAGYSWGNSDAMRDAVLASTSNRHFADYDHNVYEVAARVEYTGLPELLGIKIAPELGVGYARYEQSSFTEEGDLATALFVSDAKAESMIGSVGVNLTGPAIGGIVSPISFIRYEHDFDASSDGAHDLDAGFATSPTVTQSFVGTHRGEAATIVGLGLGTPFGSDIQTSIGVVYTHNTYGEELGGGLRFMWSF